MKHTIHKLIFDYAKEEKWLNSMAAKGFNFIGYTFATYHFQEGLPGEYTYRLELLDHLPSHPESLDYVRFMEEAGIEYVDNWFRWVYFRKKASDGPFELYSDYPSKIAHYRRISWLVFTVLLLNLLAALLNIFTGIWAVYDHRTPFNLYISTISLSVCLILLPIYISTRRRISWLRKEHNIRE